VHLSEIIVKPILERPHPELPSSVHMCCSALEHELKCRSGLPDGTFEKQKSKFWYNLKGLGMDTFGMFNDLLVFLWSIDIFYGYNFPRFDMLYQEKSGNPGVGSFPLALKINESNFNYIWAKTSKRSFRERVFSSTKIIIWEGCVVLEITWV
jgi:hypothetical protein